MRRRFIIALILALLPFALLSSGQAVWRLVRAHETARADLAAAAQASTAREANVIASTEAVLATLESRPEIRASSEGCVASLQNALNGTSYYTNIFRLDRNGVVRCSAIFIEPSLLDRHEKDWWKKLQGRRNFYISEQHVGQVSKTNVLTAALPMFASDGTFDGALAVGIRGDFLARLMMERELPRGAVAALIDSDGKIISTSGSDESRAIFQDLAPLQNEALISVRDPSGVGWLVAVAAVLDKDLYIAFAERESALFAWSYFDVGANILLPLLIAGFAFGVIWYSADRFMLRWVTYLQRVARAYGRGHLALRPSLAETDAPPEIRHLASAMGDMAASIRQRDSSLRQALEQRSLMLREIHHRVKNNLQIIGSLLQIEVRRIEEPAAQAALKMTQTRINAIALAHRVLEEVDSQTVVNLRRLLADLSRLLHDAFGEGLASDGLNVTAPDILIETDVAVPLSLLMVELLSDIYRVAVDSRNPALGLDITAARIEPDRLQLEISYDGLADLMSPGHGPNFSAAYLRQLRADVAKGEKDGRTWTTINFPERTGGSPKANPL